MIHAGIDAGSRAIKIVLFDDEKRVAVASDSIDQGVAQNDRAETLLLRLCADIGIDRACVKKIVATGYGRNIIRFADHTITEITCHANGVRHLVPEVRTVIEIGGQDSKAIHLKEMGRVQDFTMNDRCAAGTGRFLEVIATRLELELDTFGKEAMQSTEPARISSMCVVFAETEIIGLLAAGIHPRDIAAGVQASVATRVASMTGRSIETPVVFTGGVAMIPGMPQALEKALGHPLIIPDAPQFTGALGAALLSARDS